MKIALVAPSEIPARRANTVQVMKMAQALATCGHEVRLASPERGSRASRRRPQWEELARLYGLRERFEVSWLPAFAALRGYDYGLRALLWARRWKADLLYTRLPQAAAFASQIGMPTVLEVHDLPAGRAGGLLFRLFLAGRGRRRLVAITQALAGDLARRFNLPERPGFLLAAPDGVDLQRYEPQLSVMQARQRLSQQTGLSLP
jgi:hypothetical protein